MSWIELVVHRGSGQVRMALTVRYTGREFLEHRVWSGAHKSYSADLADGASDADALRVALETVLAGLRDRLDIDQAGG